MKSFRAKVSGKKLSGKFLSRICFLIFIVLIVGCASKSNDGNNDPKGDDVTTPRTVEQEKPLEPVTLKVQQLGAYFTTQDFNELIAEPVKRKYPHLTVELNASTESPQTLLARAEVFDFLVTFHGNIPPYKELGILMDMDPLAKKHNFDLGRFDPGALEAIRVISDKGELYALPYAANLNALYYNKDIFDKFGIDYPSDGLSWTETIEIAKRVTKTDDGIQYRGLDTDAIERLLFPLSLLLIDARSHQVQVNSEPYKRVFETAKQMYSIDGNEYDTSVGSVDRFLKNKNLAMIATVNLFLRFREITDLEWDVAQFPSYEERPNTYGLYDLHVAIPMAMSKHPDDLMRVLEVLFSDEIQTVMVRKSLKVSTLQDPKYAQQFGLDLPGMENKNIAGIFKSKPAPAPEFSLYWSGSRKFLTDEYVMYLRGEKDVNTALRDAEEKLKLHLETELAKTN